MPTLVVTNFNIVCAVVGGFVTVFGLVSYLLKERFYLSEALISLLAGVAFSPYAANFIRPMDYAMHSEENLEYINLYFTRLVLGVQLVASLLNTDLTSKRIAGIQLPHRYLQSEWKPLALLLGPGMTIMWISASLLIWALVPNLPFLHALAVGACVTPTDPILSNSIVKGKFADKNIPKPLQRIIIAESGANDGLGYPFLFLPLYIIKHAQHGGEGGAGKAMEQWFVETWLYTIFMSIAYGAVVGWIAKELLHKAEERKFVDRESFLVFALTLALFITGTCGMIGSDDVLACFIAGNAFTWDDWFRLQTEDDSLQPTIDMLLNISVFAWFGAVCPWVAFRVNEVIPIYRLIFLGILMLLFRRIPVIMALWKYIPQIDDYQQALFVGFFGPIGVSAIFYLYISLDFIKTIPPGPDGEKREDIKHLGEVMTVVIWFLAICSIVVHGLSVPMGKLGYHTPRVLSQALSTSQDNDEPNVFLHHFHGNSGQLRRRRNVDRQPSTGAFRIGRSSANPRTEEDNLEMQSAAEPPRPVLFPGTGQNTPTRVGSRSPSRETSVVVGKDVSIPSGDMEMGFETAGKLEVGRETVKTA